MMYYGLITTNLTTAFLVIQYFILQAVCIRIPARVFYCHTSGQNIVSPANIRLETFLFKFCHPDSLHARLHTSVNTHLKYKIAGHDRSCLLYTSRCV